MHIPFYQVDAFTDKVFGGNPAAVCLLENWPEDRVLQNIAAENNLSETAFLVGGGADYDLRWFTPALEIDLCGHATLASAFVIFSPNAGIPEDPVTGSAHCTLVPYWSARLGKKKTPRPPGIRPGRRAFLRRPG